MSNIRIKDIATTAASTASDDFIAIDGATNGTRKLDIYNPTIGGNVTVSGQGLFSSGTSATPSIAFSSDTGTGLYRYSSGATALASAGQRAFVWNGSGEMYGPGLNCLLTLASAGSISLTAGGTNQNITLTPSGNGVISNGAQLGLNKPIAQLSQNITASGVPQATYPGFIQISGNGNGDLVNYCGGIEFLTAGAGNGYGVKFGAANNAGANLLQILSRQSSATWTEWARWVGSNLLLGTATDSSNGKLQLATHTTSAGGIGFGTDTSLYRSSGGTIYFDTSGGSVSLNFTRALAGGSQLGQVYFDTSQGIIGTIGTQQLIIRTNSTAAITLDTSQNATFAGIAILKSYTVATLPAAAAGNTYGIVFVSDATNAAGTGIGTAPTGGGAVKRAVYSTGAAWLLL